MPPPAELRNRPQDGISRVQKVAAVEIGFRGAPGCFWGIWVYIGGRSRSVELRGAHEGGGCAQGVGRASLACGHLEASLTSTPSLLDCFCSKNDIPSLRNTEIGNKTAIWAGPPVNRLVPKII